MFEGLGAEGAIAVAWWAVVDKWRKVKEVTTQFVKVGRWYPKLMLSLALSLNLLFLQETISIPMVKAQSHKYCRSNKLQTDNLLHCISCPRIQASAALSHVFARAMEKIWKDWIG